jgi:hypothetical protein
MRRRTSAWSETGSDLVYGALAGLVGAACMTPLRLAARRAGLIDKALHQTVEETLAHKLGVGRGTGAEPHHLASSFLHFGYGAAQGAVYRLAARRRSRKVVRNGLLMGALSWLINGTVVVPAMNATRPIWRARPRENLVNLGAHVVFGVVTALLSDELARQQHHRPTTDLRRWFTSVG